MEIYRCLADSPSSPRGCVVTVGNFDGVHLGHQAIIRHARRLAQTEQLPLVGVTFEPAPVRVLRPDQAPRLLTPLDIKIRLLEQQDLHRLLILESAGALLSLAPEEFVRQVLVDRLRARHVVEGQTFGFGRGREGTVVSLEALGRELGFQTHMVPAQTIVLDEAGPVAISSTLVRRHIMIGRFDLAARCLTRPYLLGGTVVRGRGTGAALGFPTANLQLYHPGQLTGEDGVLAAWARLGADLDQAWAGAARYRAAVSIGRGKTFPDGRWQIEAHLLDYPKDAPDLQGQHLLLSIVARVRPQQRFAGSAELAEAIRRDCQTIDRILRQQGAPPL